MKLSNATALLAIVVITGCAPRYKQAPYAYLPPTAATVRANAANAEEPRRDTVEEAQAALINYQMAIGMQRSIAQGEAEMAQRNQIHRENMERDFRNREMMMQQNRQNNQLNQISSDLGQINRQLSNPNVNQGNHIPVLRQSNFGGY